MVAEDEVLEEADGIRGASPFPDHIENLAFTLILAWIKGADHTNHSVRHGEIGWATIKNTYEQTLDMEPV
jgi:hypothetical protein